MMAAVFALALLHLIGSMLMLFGVVWIFLLAYTLMQGWWSFHPGVFWWQFGGATALVFVGALLYQWRQM